MAEQTISAVDRTIDKKYNPPLFDPQKLSEQDKKNFNFVQKRILELRDARMQNHYGTDLEEVWAAADREYIPHRYKTKGKKVFAEDEVLGWRGTLVTLGANDWQSDISQANPYIKIQTALSILVDQNPVGIFTPASKKFEATSELMKQLYQRSWEFAKSKQQLKLFVFNLAKYGWAIARTYPLHITRKVKNLIEYDPADPSKTKYEEKEITEYNDLFRENLDIWNVWIDDMALPNNQFSIRDWAWRKIYSWDVAKEEFGKYPNFKYCKPGGTTFERLAGKKAPDKKYREKDLVEIWFYENRIKDLFEVHINNIPVIQEPLPISDANGNKKLSLWQTYWNLRHSQSPYGIGIFEAIRYDHATKDRVRNMTIDQLVLSIYKMFFYQGTTALTDTGDIQIQPGIGKNVLDSKNINWLEVPPPGAEAWKGLEVFQKDIDDTSGIGDSLLGTITGKTAFEIAQAKESALKRLKTPLDNITDALNIEAYITLSLIQLLYSVPEVHEITNKDLEEAYLNEIQSDPDLYERQGNKFNAKIYREFPLNLSKDEKGNLTQDNMTQFFRIKPKLLNWEGIINVKSQSVLTPSKQVDKALELELFNMLIPLLGQQPQVFGKIAREMVKLYDKDPKDLLPDEWSQEQKQQQQEPLIVPIGGQQQNQTEQQGQPQPGQQAPTMAANPQMAQNPKNMSGKITSKLKKVFKKV